MKLFIQNMVSGRCKMFVKAELDKLNIAYKSIILGEVVLVESICENKRLKLGIVLHQAGLELIYNKNAALIEKIINIVVQMVHYSEEIPKVNFSIFLSDILQQDYHKIAAIFSSYKGITLEHFIILHKVEKIKELIIYEELNLTEISNKMHYADVAHLSRQFKQVTGFTPTFFKSSTDRKRCNLEDL